MIVIQIIGVIVGAYVLYMFFIAIVPGFKVPSQPLERGKSRVSEEVDQLPRSRRDVGFVVDGTQLSAWLYLPEDLSGQVPCIIMAHGLGVTRETGLDAYARRFQKAGFAVLAFDYRHFGESGGEPRQLAWIPYQQEDWSAAVEYVRSLQEIDPTKIALWGTSLSGGHVIMIAARDSEIACVSAQCPLLDGRAGGMDVVKELGLGYILKMTFGHALRDLIRSWLGLSPHKIPLVGKPGTVAALADAGAWNMLEEVAPEGFINEVCARILIRMDKYRPIKKTSEVHCPVLLQVCDKDISLPMSTVDKAERQLGELGEVIHYPIDHFDIYLGSDFEQAVSDQLTFFSRHLL